MKIYLVIYRRTGVVCAVFADQEDAQRFVTQHYPKSAIVEERTVCHGQQALNFVE